MGDLNYRLDSSFPLQELLNQLEEHPELLQQYDQLSRSISRRAAFQGYSELKLQFPPTYKFIKGGNTYNPSKEPAWCDRILTKGTCTVKHYASVPEATCSDHKPVVADICLSCKKYRYTEMNAIANKIRSTLVANDSYPIDLDIPECICFDSVRINEPQKQNLTLSNRGNGNAYFQFVSRCNSVCKEWYRIEPLCGVIRPHSSCVVSVQILLSPRNYRVGVASHYQVVDSARMGFGRRYAFFACGK